MERLIRRGRDFLAERVVEDWGEFLPIHAKSFGGFLERAASSRAEAVLIDTMYYEGGRAGGDFTGISVTVGEYFPPAVTTRFRTIGVPLLQRVHYQQAHEVIPSRDKEETRLRQLLTAHEESQRLQALLPDIPVRVVLRKAELDKYDDLLEEARRRGLEPYPRKSKAVPR